MLGCLSGARGALVGGTATIMLALGCSAVRYPRTNNAVLTGEGLLLSNSPTWVENVAPELVNGELRLQYSLFAHNVGPGSYAVLLARTTFETRGKAGEVRCRPHQRPPAEAFIVRPRMRVRIDCDIRYSALATRELAGAAADAEFTLWLERVDERDEHGPSAWTSRYTLLAEDFE